MAWSWRVVEESRCLPAKMRRRSEEGRFVLKAKRLRRVDMEVVDGTESGIMFPAMFLTNIWMVSSSAEEVEEREEMLLERLEGRMMAVSYDGVVR